MAATKGPVGVLTRKVGPAPVWLWFAAGMVLYLAYRAFANRSASSSGSATGGGTSLLTPGVSTNGGSSASSGQGTAADNLSGDLLSSLAGNLVDTNTNLVYALQSTVGAVEGLGYGAYGLAGQALDANRQLGQAIIDKYTPSYSSVTPAASPSLSGSATTLPAASSQPQYAQQTWVAAPYYSSQGQVQGAGPTPTGANQYSLGTLRGAGYGNNLSIV